MKRLLLLLILLQAGYMSAATYVVDRNDDADVGACTAAANDCTLRGAIKAANATAQPAIINFAIASGVQTIAVGAGGLPAITVAVTINGATQPGFNGTPLIELNGSGAGFVSGLTISGGSSLVRALAVNRFDRAGIEIPAAGGGGSTIQGCFIGTDVTGTAVLGNGFGVYISHGRNNTVGGTSEGARNIISGNRQGVEIEGSEASGNVVAGNFIGTDVTGTAGLGNTFGGVLLNGPDNTIGGTTVEGRNLISGNTGNGVTITGNSVGGNLVMGNFIGTDVTGTVALGNTADGVFLDPSASNCTIGSSNLISGNAGDGVGIDGGSGNMVRSNLIGTDITGTVGLGNGGDGVVLAGDRNLVTKNLISGNNHNGVEISGDFSSSNKVQGNLIGTDLTGRVALGNGTESALYTYAGVFVAGAQNTIGGTEAAVRNLISGNLGSGVTIAANNVGRNVVQGNFIGTDVTGSAALGNAVFGVFVDGAPDNTIGGIAGAGNTIAFNSLIGVAVNNAVGNQIFGNSIYRNGGLGIDLSPAGVTPNDEGDTDNGANNLQNFPVIESAVSSGGETTIRGAFNTIPAGVYFIDLYSSVEADPTGYGEGQTYLGAVRVERSTTFSFTTSSDLAGQFITATATNASTNDTSEFSAALLATAGPGPTPNPSPAAQPLNISTRLRVQTADNVLIGGFIIRGDAPKKLIVRALGPSLASSIIAGPLANPVIELHGPGGELIAQNDNWRETQEAEIQASGLAPEDDSEAAIIATLPPNGYTVIVRGKNGSTGIGLVEAYDLQPTASSEFANISTRGFVETGDSVMIGGFILGGNGGATRVALRGLGQSLANAGLSNVLANPTLDLRDANGTRIAFNDDWMDNPAQAVQLTANGLALQDPHEAGIFTTLAPGAYTVILAGENGGGGVGLIEVYKVDK